MKYHLKQITVFLVVMIIVAMTAFVLFLATKKSLIKSMLQPKQTGVTIETKLKICQRRAFVTKEGITISPAKKGLWVVGYPNQFLGEGTK